MIRVYSPESFEDYRTTKNFCMYENHWLTWFFIRGETAEIRDRRRNKINELLAEIHNMLDANYNPCCYILNASDYVDTIPDPETNANNSSNSSGINDNTYYYANIIAFFQEDNYEYLNEIIDKYIVAEAQADIGGGTSTAKKVDPHWSSNNHPSDVATKFGHIQALRREIGIFRHQRFLNYYHNISNKLSGFDNIPSASQMIAFWTETTPCIEINHRFGNEYDATFIQYDNTHPSHMDDPTDYEIFMTKYRQLITTYVNKVNNGDYGSGKTAEIVVTTDPMRVKYSDETTANRVNSDLLHEMNVWMNTEPQLSKRYSALFQLNFTKVEVEIDESVYFVIYRDTFENNNNNSSYNNYIKKLFISKFHHNGSMILQPSECILNVELNGSWYVDLTQPYDEDHRYSYLQEGCVLGIDLQIAREQVNQIQYFRVFDIEYGLNDIQATAYPVAFEAAFEVPILSCDFSGDDFEGYTAKDLAALLNNLQRNKFRIRTNIDSTKACVYGEETNLQEILVGDQDASFLNMFGGEVVYDNYDYIINTQIGNNNPKLRTLYYSGNITGMSITKNTWDLITRIEPLSSEGYSMVGPEYRWARRKARYWFEGGTRGGGNDVISDDSVALRNHPFVHAKVIKYDDVYLVKEYDEEYDGYRKKTKTEKATKAAKTQIKKTVKDITADYFDRARKGSGMPDSRMPSTDKLPDTTYIDPRNASGFSGVKQRSLRKKLPYGYILYSWEDAKKYLINEAVGNVNHYVEKTKLAETTFAPEEIDLYSNAIDEGMAWCQKTVRAKWYWHTSGDYRYYGNKNAVDPSKAARSYHGDRVENAMWNIDNYWIWFDENGRAINELFDYDTYEWFEDDSVQLHVNTWQEVTEDEQTKIKKSRSEKKENAYKFGDPNDHTKIMEKPGWWIERSATEHYQLSPNNNRQTIDKIEWIFSETKDDNGVTHTYYKSKDGKRYPAEGQYMYVSEKKAWYKFKAGGEMIGPYLSKATFSWHKDGTGWFYGDDAGTKLKCQWIKMEGKWFFLKADGYLDKSTDDYDENDPAKTQDGEKTKQLSIDWNREGVGGGTSTSGNSIATETDGDTSPDLDRDGVKGWIKKAVIDAVATEIVERHNVLWSAFREDLTNHAKADLKSLTSAAISVTIDIQSLIHAEGYEQYGYLNDVKLGDAVQVYSSVHNLDLEERVTAIKYDCLNDELQEITLGYPKIKKSFINNVAKLHPHGLIQEYTPSVYLEDGFGGYLLTTDPEDADVGDENGLAVY